MSPIWGAADAGRRWRISFPVTAALLLVAQITAHADPLSVKEFNEKLDGWKAAKKDVPPITLEVEGRIKTYGHDRLTLQNCKVQFHSKKELPSRTRDQVVVVGKVSRDVRTHEYTFQVSSIRFIPGEHEQFAERRRQLKPGVADECYALGRWAAVRADFYDDEKLKTYADEVYHKGLEIEHKALAKSDPDGLLALADKARQFRQPNLSDELTHEAYRLFCERSRDQSVAELRQLANRLADTWPEVRNSLDKFPEELVADYKRRPLDTYNGADQATRLVLQRWLYAELQLRVIASALKPDGSNGFEIAEQIDGIVRGHPQAEEYRDRALKSRAAEVEKLTRTQVVELAEQYRLRKQPRQANDVLESWLTMRKQALEPDDTEGLLILSEDYRRLLERDDLADRLLIDGWTRNPKASDLEERLEKQGFRLFEGRWLSPREFASRPEGELEDAIRKRLVKKDMTAAQVRRSWGKPDAQARSATAREVTEIWTYKMSDGSPRLVRFVKKAGQREMSVVEVHEDKGK
jgi:hypothetical protein